MADDYDVLKSSAIFANIPVDEIPFLLKSVGATVATWKKGEVIRSAGDEMHFFGVVLSGVVQASLPQNGRDQIVGRFPEGESFAEAAPVALKRTPVTITCVKDARAICIDPDNIAVSPHPFATTMHANLMAEMSKKLVHLSTKLSILGEPRLRQRIVMYLNSQPVQDDGSVDVPMSFKELADYLGVNNTALSRELGRMQDDGVISMGRHSIKLLDQGDVSGANGGEGRHVQDGDE